MGMSLFEIDATIRDTISQLYDMMDETGELPEEGYAVLDRLQADRKAKLENIALYYKELKAEADALEAEAKKLATRAKTASKRAEFFKNYIATSMLGNGDTELKTSRCAITFRKSEKVVTDETLARAYLVRKIEYAPDKKLIKELLKSGKKIRGARLEESQNIQIN